MSSATSGGSGAGLRRWQLPADVSGFVGRTGERARLAAQLREARLVTVTGPGGIGKTRLALRTAADLTAGDGGRRNFPDGGCLIDLSGHADAGQLPNAIASGLGLPETDPRSRLARVFSLLRGTRLLLILDTCEHLSGACARFAAQLLRETGGVTILATSRQPLHLPGERVLRLGPLPVPESPPVSRYGALADSTGDAVELFTQRAMAALPGFTVTAAAQPDMVRLCQRLEGIPLAIELAALRVRALPLTVLSGRPGASLATQTGRRRGTVDRHQTLHAAIAWSYGLCTPAEQAVWQRLSGLAGPFDQATAVTAAACAEIPADQVRRVLAALVDKSVLLPADGSRYWLPGPAREYAAERLACDDQNAGGDGTHRARPLATASRRAGDRTAGDRTARNWEAAGDRPAGDRGTGNRGTGDQRASTAAAAGASPAGLTSREHQIAALVASGLSNREIAERLVISRRTVDAHINHIFGKLGLSSRVQLTLWLHDRGQVPQPRSGELSPTVRA